MFLVRGHIRGRFARYVEEMLERAKDELRPDIEIPVLARALTALLAPIRGRKTIRARPGDFRGRARSLHFTRSRAADSAERVPWLLTTNSL